MVRSLKAVPSRSEILRRLAPSNVFQPATMFWRVFEIEAIWRHARLLGRGVDLGCGDGQLTSVVVSAYTPRPALIGVEPDPRDYALALASGIYEEVHCTTGDAIPVASGSLDFAFSNSTLEHIPQIAPVLADTARVLRPGGEFVFTVPSDEFHACLRGSALIETLARGRRRTYRELIDERLAHYRYHSPDEWTATLRDAGFVETRWARYFSRSAVRVWETLSNSTGGLAFELLGAKRPTRQIQHGLRLSRRAPNALAGAVATMVALVGRRALQEEIGPGEPSGGLILIATRA
jgi:SAM-dependent methyltransferase